MVLSGEGADEVFGGYLYFHKAPNKEEFHKETVRKVNSKIVKLFKSFQLISSSASETSPVWLLES